MLCNAHAMGTSSLVANLQPQHFRQGPFRSHRSAQCLQSRCRAVTAEAHESCEGEAWQSTSDAHLVSVQDGAYTVEGALSTGASFGEVWSLLTDYAKLSDTFSNIRESHVVSTSPDVVLKQECKWEFLIFSGSFSAELTVKEERSRGLLTFSLIQSSFMHEFVGQWKISERDGGGCGVEHRLRVLPKLSPPAFMSTYTQRVFVKQVSRILLDLEEQLSRQKSTQYALESS